MDVQAEKLHLIEQLARLEDVSIIQKIKEVLQSSDEGNVVGYNPDGSIITKADLISRAEVSEQDIKEGRVKNLSVLKEEIKNW